jgi:hypothetical protein
VNATCFAPELVAVTRTVMENKKALKQCIVLDPLWNIFY